MQNTLGKSIVSNNHINIKKKYNYINIIIVAYTAFINFLIKYWTRNKLWNVATNEWEVYNWKEKIILFVVQFES